MIDFDTYKLEGPDEIYVMDLVGTVDLDTSDFLLDCIQNHIEDDVRRLVLDCSKLDYISSVGLGILVRANSRMKKIGGAIALAGVQGMVAEVFRITHLDRLFNMYPNVHEAAKSLARR